MDFAAAYDDHVWDVYGFIAYRVQARELAEDLTQATFERALRAWDRFDPQKASVKTWLLTIARNIVIDHYRSDRSAVTDPLPDPPGAPAGPADALDERGLGPSPELASALDRLSEREREVIALRFGGDMTGAQIAELTGLGVANVQQILSRSLRRLRDALVGTPANARNGEPED